MVTSIQSNDDDTLALLSESRSESDNYGTDDGFKRTDTRKTRTLNAWDLFRFANRTEFVLLAIGTLASVVTGLGLLGTLVLYSSIGGTFVVHSSSLCSLDLKKYSEEHCPYGIELSKWNVETMIKYCNFTTTIIKINDLNNFLHKDGTSKVLLLLGIGIIQLVSGILQYSLFEITSRRQANRIRIHLFDLIIRRNIVFFDSTKTGTLTTNLFANVEKIQGAIGWTLSFMITDGAFIVATVITSLIINWRLSLIMLTIGLPIVIISIIFSRVTANVTNDEFESISKANSVVEEVFGSLRTVLAFNGIDFEKERYEKYLNEIKPMSRRKGVVYASFYSINSCLLVCVYPFLLYFGSEWMHAKENTVTITQLLIILTCAVECLLCIGTIAPFGQLLAEAIGAAVPIWQLMDESTAKKHAKYDFQAAQPIAPIKTINRGEIKFDRVSFTYPARPTVQILNEMNLVIESGKTTALVGTSGCGKSTCVQLILGFYDKFKGNITIDGHPIEQYDIQQIRSSIGVVSQEPVLFATSIYENIRLGNENATQRDIEKAAQQANADDFIQKLPDVNIASRQSSMMAKYATLVGERGLHLSGGEKQRIALARALVRKPTILILDEATSALDYRNEAIVQEALDRACEGRTTLIIAHRLSTIRRADMIYVLQNGTCVESGKHSDLFEQDGHYASLVKFQQYTININDNDTRDEEQPLELTIHRQYSQSKTAQHEGNDSQRGEEKKSEKNRNLWRAFVQIMLLNKPEWIYILGGCLSSLLCGLTTPSLAVLLGYSLKIVQDCDTDAHMRRLSFLFVLFFLLAIMTLVFQFTQNFLFSCSGSALVRRLRLKTFVTMLRQDIAWHDRSENHTGALCVRLSSDAAAVEKMTGIRIGLLFESLGNWSIAFLLGMLFSWQMTLIATCYIICLCALSFLDIRATAQLSKVSQGYFEKASSMAIEVFQNIRTVKQLSKEDHFVFKYKEMIEKTFSIARNHIFVGALIGGFIISALPFVLCALYAEALSLVEHHILKPSNLI